MEGNKKKDLNEKLLDGEVPVHERDIFEDEEDNKYCWSQCCAKLNNKTVLLIVCCLFACFATSEVVGAVAAHSLALLGDSTASCVDVVTYFGNYYAEHLATPKAPTRRHSRTPSGGNGGIEVGRGDTSGGAATAKSQGYAGVNKTDEEVISDDDSLARNPVKDERTRMIHEVYVPAFSLATLLIVTIVIMSLAVLEIRTGGDSGTHVEYLFAYASVNVVIDLVCITMFYYRKDDIMHNRFPSFTGEPIERTLQPGQKTMFSNANINMFAAFTHIGSDTLRTIAIFVAAIVSSTTGLKSSLCDAWAAIIVSFTIFFAIIPLSREVYHAYIGQR